MTTLNEKELPNDYPVYWDYLYVADGKLIRSNIQGTVLDLKRDLRCKVITSCDLEGRITNYWTKEKNKES